MTSNNLRYWLPFFAFLLGLVILNIAHEEAHVQIFRSYQIDSHIEYFKHLPYRIATISNEPCPNEFCNLAHNLNEVVGYTIIALYTSIGVIYLTKRAIDFKLQ